MAQQQDSGFTIIELMVTIVLIAIVAAIALPSFKSLLENRKLIAAANSLQADFQYAKTEAVKRNKNVFISFENVAASNWCYGINESSSCDCSVANDCSVKVVNISDLPAVVLNTDSATDISYDPFRGFTNIPEGDEWQYNFLLGGKSTSVINNLTGNTVTCSGNAIGGFDSC